MEDRGYLVAHPTLIDPKGHAPAEQQHITHKVGPTVTIVGLMSLCPDYNLFLISDWLSQYHVFFHWLPSLSFHICR